MNIIKNYFSIILIISFPLLANCQNLEATWSKSIDIKDKMYPVFITNESEEGAFLLSMKQIQTVNYNVKGGDEIHFTYLDKNTLELKNKSVLSLNSKNKKSIFYFNLDFGDNGIVIANQYNKKSKERSLAAYKYFTNDKKILFEDEKVLIKTKVANKISPFIASVATSENFEIGKGKILVYNVKKKKSVVYELKVFDNSLNLFQEFFIKLKENESIKELGVDDEGNVFGTMNTKVKNNEKVIIFYIDKDGARQDLSISSLTGKYIRSSNIKLNEGKFDFYGFLSKDDSSPVNYLFKFEVDKNSQEIIKEQILPFKVPKTTKDIKKFSKKYFAESITMYTESSIDSGDKIFFLNDSGGIRPWYRKSVFLRLSEDNGIVWSTPIYPQPLKKSHFNYSYSLIFPKEEESMYLVYHKDDIQKEKSKIYYSRVNKLTGETKDYSIDVPKEFQKGVFKDDNITIDTNDNYYFILAKPGGYNKFSIGKFSSKK